MKKADYFFAVAGVLLAVTGVFLVMTLENPQGILLTLPYVLLGAGCGMFGYGMSNIISKKAISKDEKLQKQLAVEEKDERNIAISNKAKAKAYDFMTFTFGILLLILTLMNTDMIALLLLVAAYLSVQIYAIYYRFKYEKEM